MTHTCRIYYTYEQFAQSCTTERFARKTWKEHLERRGNVPFIVKCLICSGAETLHDMKSGRMKPTKKRKRDLFGYNDF